MSIALVGSPLNIMPVTATNTISGSFSLTNASGNNRLVVIFISFADSQVTGSNLINACTFNSVGATAQVTSNPGGTSRVVCSIQTLNDAALPASAGSYTVNVGSSDATTDIMAVTVIEYSGVDQTTPVNSNKPTSTAFGTTASLTPSTAGDLQLGCLASHNALTFTVSTSDTQRGNSVTFNGGISYGSHCVAETTDGTINFSQSLDTATEAAVAISLNAAAAAGVTFSALESIDRGMNRGMH